VRKASLFFGVLMVDEVKNKILVTGANTFVGREVVKNLSESGYSIIQLLDQYNIADVEAKSVDAVALIHMDYLAQTASTSENELIETNLKLPLKVAAVVRSAGVKKFINVTSVHALPGGDKGPYSVSRRILVNELLKIKNLNVVNIFRAAPYNNWVFSGRLSVFNRLPVVLKQALFRVFKSIAATSNVKAVSDAIEEALNDNCQSERIVTDGQSKSLMYWFFQHAVNLSFSIACVLLFWWLLAFVWMAVKIGSAGPGLFLQDRVGRDGKIFKCVKFRTMFVETQNLGTHQVSQAAVTKVGRFLRRTKLDELPQLWNLLKGEMSLIGPRPCLPSQTELIRERKQKNILSIKPGITGFAQVNDIDMSDPYELANWDSRYLKLCSIAFDLKILKSTFLGGGQGDKVNNK